MRYSTIFLISIGLAMDSFIVSICKGISMKKMSWKKAIIIGFYFSFFQAIMPIIGFFFGYKFEGTVKSVANIIAFILLGMIGGNMIFEAFDSESQTFDDSINPKLMIELGIATSIDALAIGISFAFLSAPIYEFVCFARYNNFFTLCNWG